MNAQQLRNSILQQAIQGKLVPQDPNDEPASVLLQRIRKEKERLVKEGKLKKKDLESKPIEEDEIPFELPMGWEWCKLNDCLDVRDGTHDTPKYVTSGYPLVTSKNLRNGIIDFKGALFISKEDHEAISCRSKVDENDILYAMIGTVGNPVLVRHKDFDFSIKNMALFKHVGDFVFMDYVYWYLYYAQVDMKAYASGGVQTFVSLGYLRNYLIPLPPLAEQRRIVAKIEELMPLVERYGKAQQALDQLNESLPARLRQSILQEAIQGRLVPQDPKEEPASELLNRIRKEKEQLVKEGKLKKKDLESKPIEEDEIPFEIPESWEWSKIGVICTITNGFTPLRTEEKYWKNGEVNWFTVEDIREQGEHIRYTKQKITTIATTSERIVRPGSVLLCCTASVGQCAITHIPTTTNQQFNALTVRDEYRQLVSDDYLFLFSKTLKDELHRLSGKTTFEFVSVKKVGDILIPLPPLSEQKRIVAKVEELFGVMKK
jgi:type I restriction enzyme S subunit